MLSRTADSLFWLARYMERAENTARLIDMGRRMSAIPGVGPDCVAGRRSEWPSILAATGCTEGFNSLFATKEYQELDLATATCRYLLLEQQNPSSVRGSFDAARANARAIRVALTREMWESVNDSWNYFRRLSGEHVRDGGMSPLLEMIKMAAAQFRGAAEASALRNDGYEFMRLGFAIEKLDCTARLLDVKATPARRMANDGVIDRYRYMALLRASGQLLAYRARYRADYDDALIDEFLVSEAQCPRSLLHSAMQVQFHLARLSALYGATSDCAGEADALIGFIRQAPIQSMSSDEMHDFLSQVIEANSKLAASIAAAYHFGPSAKPTQEEASAQASQLDDAPPQKAESKGVAAEAQVTAEMGAGENQRSQDLQASDGEDSPHRQPHQEASQAQM